MPGRSPKTPKNSKQASKYVDNEAMCDSESEHEYEFETPETSEKSNTTPPKAPKKARGTTPKGITKPGKKQQKFTEEVAKHVLSVRSASPIIELGKQTSFQSIAEVLSSPTAFNIKVIKNKSDKANALPFAFLHTQFAVFVELEHLLPKLSQFGQNELLFRSETKDGKTLMNVLQRADEAITKAVLDSIEGSKTKLKQNLCHPNPDYPKIKLVDTCVVKSDIKLTDDEVDPSLELLNELAGLDGASKKTFTSRILLNFKPYALLDEEENIKFGFSVKALAMKLTDVKERATTSIPKFDAQSMIDEL